MKTDQHIWRDWASFLHQWGVGTLAASLLEAAGPLAVLGAQVVYLGQPLLYHILPEDHLDAMAKVMEDTEYSQAFLTYLRETSSQ